MKILFPVGAFYPSQIGGPCNTIYWHTTALQQNGIEVKIVTTTAGIKENNVITDKFIDLVCGKTYYSKGGPVQLNTIIIALSEIKSADILHLNSLFSWLSSITFIYSKIF